MQLLPYLLVSALVISTLRAQPSAPANLEIDEDRASKLVLAKEWKIPPVVRDGSGKVRAAPFWSSVWAEDRSLVPGADVPLRPETLMKQPTDRVLAWGTTDHGLKWDLLATEHAVLVLAMPRIPQRFVTKDELAWLKTHFDRIPSRGLTPNQAAHLYGYRYLKAEAEWMDLMSLWPDGESFLPSDLPDHFGSRGRSEMFVFSLDSPYQEFGRHFFGASGKWSSYWWLKETQTIVGACHMEGVTHPAFEARFHSLVAHNLLYQYRNFYFYIPAWVPAGLLHFFERRYPGRSNTYMMLGAPVKERALAWTWDKDRWWTESKKMVTEEATMPITQLGLQFHYQDLEPRLHVQAWSLTTYMLSLGVPRYRTFIDTLLQKEENESILEAQQRAFIKAYGVNMVVFENAWKEWVKGTRAPKGE
jgi:hypothetical protein